MTETENYSLNKFRDYINIHYGDISGCTPSQIVAYVSGNPHGAGVINGFNTFAYRRMGPFPFGGGGRTTFSARISHLCPKGAKTKGFKAAL